MIKNWLRFVVVLTNFLFVANIFAGKITIAKQDNFIDPQASFYDVEGNKVYLDTYEGKTVLLVFWATWCGACVNEMLSLDNLQYDFRKLPFKILAISEDQRGVEVVKEFFIEKDIRHLSIFHDQRNSLFKLMEVTGLPTAYLIDPDGRIKLIFNGLLKWHNDEVRRTILNELDGNLELPKNTFQEVPINRRITNTGDKKKLPNKDERERNDAGEKAK